MFRYQRHRQSHRRWHQQHRGISSESNIRLLAVVENKRTPHGINSVSTCRQIRRLAGAADALRTNKYARTTHTHTRKKPLAKTSPSFRVCTTCERATDFVTTEMEQKSMRAHMRTSARELCGQTDVGDDWKTRQHTAHTTFYKTDTHQLGTSSVEMHSYFFFVRVCFAMEDVGENWMQSDSSAG